VKLGLTAETKKGNFMQMDRDTDTIRKIHRRQVARLLDHLKRTDQYTIELEKDIKRSFSFVFQDVEDVIKQGNDTENTHDESKR